MHNPTIFITGGHITPAIALMDAIGETYPSWQIVCVGRHIAIEGTKEESVERKLVTQRGGIFLPLMAGRLSRSFSLHTLVSLAKVPVGFVQAFWYCLKHRPAIVVSFGGYIGLPVAVAAFMLRIPVVIHEQTRVMGLANKIISVIATRICVTFDDQKHQFASLKTVVTGLPMRGELFHPPKKNPFDIDNTLPVVYVTGGSTGAVSLNDALFDAIPTLTESFVVFHQTGKLSLSKAQQLQAQLSAVQKKRYIVSDFFHTEELSWILHKAKVVVGRSGANTVMEMAVLHKPMICIPLPWSAGGEQMANAQWLADAGLGVVVEQEHIQTSKLIELVRLMPKKNKETKHASPVVLDVAARLLKEVNAILGK
jgi:UDP-N-acetylglucosamine--N-acetylmuramyl-(pentapeptide) pyrophosphoryl-undecaprenol N-acetylglucosamine transferase